ncbi:hypothetical protein KSP40_PGU017673 [Platanthera guangdongensis]|uniref:Uncharacterized protein n=1 Tax=Platanthera guangdongensis TaxID=2320717 RepID=A0ABR2LDG6_9ASPA
MDGSFDPTTMARGRLAVLTSHFVGNLAAEHLSPSLAASPVSAQEISQPPGNLGGRLKVTDSRTGKQFDLEISEEGTVKAVDFKLVSQNYSL